LIILQSYSGDISHNEDEEQDYKDTGGRLSSTFWQEIGPIECVESQVKKMVLDQFTMGDNELEFIKLCKRTAKVMHKVVLGLPADISLEDVLTKHMSKLLSLASTKCASGSCEFIPVPSCANWNYRRASDLSLSDPFPLAAIEHYPKRLL
jgi:hypothetical protein